MDFDTVPAGGGSWLLTSHVGSSRQPSFLHKLTYFNLSRLKIPVAVGVYNPGPCYVDDSVASLFALVFLSRGPTGHWGSLYFFRIDARWFVRYARF